jgi:hypothetical protein
MTFSLRSVKKIVPSIPAMPTGALSRAWGASPSRVVADAEVPTNTVTVAALLSLRTAWFPVSAR